MFVSNNINTINTAKILSVLFVLVMSAQGFANTYADKTFKIPFGFEKNIGQASEEIDYILRTKTTTVLLEGSSLKLVSNNGADSLALSFIGANREPTVTGRDRLHSVSNFILTNERKNWHRNVPSFSRVYIDNLYNDIDLVYYEKNGQLEFDFIVEEGVDAGVIQMAIANTDELTIDGKGNISALAGSIMFRQQAPLVYQYIDSMKVTIKGGYSFNSEGHIKIDLAEYDESTQLVIDPILSFSSYYGGSGADNGGNIVFDKNSNVYLAGYTTSPDLSLINPFQGALGDIASAYIAKFEITPEGTDLVYATYIGNQVTEVRGLAADNAGNIYLTGSTSSQSFPVVNAFQSVNGGLIDGYMLKLNAAGNDLVYSTYFGGTCVDRGRGMTVSMVSEEAYVTGVTCSADFPLVNPSQSSLTGIEAFLIHFSASGNSLIHSTYLGGSGSEYGYAIDVDDAGNVYMAGNTNSTDFPTLTPIQSVHAGLDDVFVTSYDDSGSVRYSTYLGGSGDDYAYRLDTDINGNVYLTGQTNSTDFPVNGSTNDTLSGEIDAVVAKINSAGTAVPFSRYIGGSGLDVARDIAIIGADSVLLGGYTTSTDFPVVNPLQAANSGNQDAFYVVLDVVSDSFTESTYLGGGGDDTALAIDADGYNNIAIAGTSDSFNFPLAASTQDYLAGDTDAFVVLFLNDNDDDGIADKYDNCPSVGNTDQSDKDANGTGDACEPPKLTGIWSRPVIVGETISLFIFGDYFDITPGATQVLINSIPQSIVQVVGPGMMIARVYVTADLLGGPVTVITANGSANGSTIFGQSSAELSITGIWPNSVQVGEYSSIFVFGNMFTTDGTTEVFFNGVRQWVVAAISSEMLIIRTLGHEGLSGHVQVNTPAGSMMSLDIINFLPL